jgi:multidrug efflux system membrane fusion protein
MGLIVNTFRAALLAAACAAPAAAQQAAAIPVTIGHATRQDVPIFVSGIGTAQPFQSVLVRARVDGTLDRIAFTEGQDVAEGAELAEIDPRPYQAVLDQAVAKKASDVALLANNRRDLARYADLAKNDFASRQSVDTQTMSVAQSIANIQSDEAAITAAKLNLEFTRITAPISGRVGIRMVDQGNLIHASDSTGIVIINQIKPISVIFTLPQDTLPLVQDATRADPNLPVLAYASDGETKLGAGTLLTADNAIDTGTGTIRLKATFPNAEERLWPGQFINAHLQLHVAKDAVVIPSSAVMRGPNGLYVYIVKPGDIAAVQPIKIGQDDGHLAVVAEGLTGAETVVLSGQSRLTDGTKVSALPTKGAANQPAGSPAPAKIAG